MHTTVGTYAHRGRWIAVCLQRSGRETLVVDERMRAPDDRHANALVVGRFRSEGRARAAAEARVLVRGGLIGADPETAACSPVIGQARRELVPGAYEIPARLGAPTRDCVRVERGVLEALRRPGDGRFVHVPARAALGR